MTPPYSKFTEAQREEIAKIVDERVKSAVHEALVEFFTTSGTTGKNFIVTTAIIVTSLGAIFLGAKALLAAIGFHYVGK